MDYRIPHMRRIERGPDTEKLYAAEERTTAALDAAARHLQDVLQADGVLPTPIHHHQDVRPEAIFTVLEGQDTGAALAACLAFVDWYRTQRPDQYADALRSWRTQRHDQCPACGQAIGPDGA